MRIPKFMVKIYRMSSLLSPLTTKKAWDYHSIITLLLLSRDSLNFGPDRPITSAVDAIRRYLDCRVRSFCPPLNIGDIGCCLKLMRKVEWVRILFQCATCRWRHPDWQSTSLPSYDSTEVTNDGKSSAHPLDQNESMRRQGVRMYFVECKILSAFFQSSTSRYSKRPTFSSRVGRTKDRD